MQVSSRHEHIFGVAAGAMDADDLQSRATIRFADPTRITGSAAQKWFDDDQLTYSKLLTFSPKLAIAPQISCPPMIGNWA